MKRILFIFLLLGFGAIGVQAQKYGFVNTQTILEKMPEYQDAQKKLDDLSEQWQKEIEAKYAEIDKMWQAYQKEKILLPDQERAKREDEIAMKERSVKELQKQRFGVTGDLFTKRQELIKPVQEKVYKAIKEVAESGGYTFIFDKANSAFILYADPKADKTEAVLKKLGL
ncbi:MAG: OmpH family outer membrane protein [Flavobacteriales bacterium]|nr:OmpH family outer membrane protein [Flavobacteriales bacterium]